MKTTFENIKTKTKDFFKTDKARIGGACVCALLICVGVGFGVSAISSQNSQNLPSKALNETLSVTPKTESENTEKQSDNATDNANENTDEVSVNDNGEVVDANGHVIAESVEQYSANPNSQSRPVNNSSNANNTPQASNSQPVQQHIHNWVEQTASVWVNPVYEDRIVCNCGFITGNDKVFDNHLEQHALNGQSTQYFSKPVEVQAGYYKEVSSGYICSTCGARQ